MRTAADLLAAAAAPTNLSTAWHRYARHRGLWTPGRGMAAVAAAPVGAMLALADEMRTGRYQPHRPAVVTVRKGDGSRRDLHVYALRDRVAQRALLQVVQARTDAAMAPGSHGFRPGRGVGTAVAAVRSSLDAGLAWVGDSDVQRCFDSIPHQGVLQQAERRLGIAGAADVLSQWMGWPRHSDACGLAQGSVLGPWLCNVYLWQLDDAMRELGTPMVRYADDFVLLTPTRNACNRALAACRDVLQRMRLGLHPGKTRVQNAALPFRFLGQWLRSTPRLEWRPVTFAAAVRGVPCC